MTTHYLLLQAPCGFFMKVVAPSQQVAQSTLSLLYCLSAHFRLSFAGLFKPVAAAAAARPGGWWQGA
jgi:hypothetical protein